jgi:hypothetical protein
MKKLIIGLYFLLIAVFMHGQNSLFEGNNALLPNNLLVNYVVNFQDNRPDTIQKQSGYYSIQYLDSGFREMIAESVKSGRISVYKVNDNDPFFPYHIFENPVKPENEDILSSLDEKLIIEMLDDGTERQIREYTDPNDLIGAFDFIEEWNWDLHRFSLTKKIIAYNPIRVSCNGEGRTIKRKSFYVIDTSGLGNKSRIKDSHLLIAKIKYEYFIDKEFCNQNGFQYADVCMPFYSGTELWNKLTQHILVNKLLNPVMEQNQEAYDFTTNDKLTLEQVKENLGMKMDIVQVLNMEDNSTTPALVQREFEPEKIKSVIFIENWYLNESDLMISKEVVGIAPVIYDEDDISVAKKVIPFVVYFDKSAIN